MTIQSTTRKVQFLGNGVTTSFPFTFKAFLQSDLQATKTSTTGVDTALVLNTNFSVALNADQNVSPGGTVTYPISGTPLSNGEKLTVLTALPQKQNTDITNNGGFYPQVIEDEFDYATILIQQLQEIADRTIKIPSSDNVAANTLGNAAARANTILYFDSTGQPYTVTPASLGILTAYATANTDQFVATAGQTVFTLTNNPSTINNLRVTLDGVTLLPGTDFTWSGTTLTLLTGALVGQRLGVQYMQGLPSSGVGTGSVVDASLAAGSIVAALVAAGVRTAAEIAAGVTPTNYGYAPGDIRRYGAQQSNTNAQNLATLVIAISVAKAATGAASQGAQAIVIPATCHYGYKVADKTTWPIVTASTVPISIYDYSVGNDYGTYPATYDGTQVRVWLFTPQTTVPGQHDGNTLWLRGSWAPNHCISNDMDLTGARVASDNRRASYTIFNNGIATWRVGQGSLASAGATDEQLSNFIIEKYSAAGDTLGGYNMVWERQTGNLGWGLSTNSPSFSYHFKSISAGYYTAGFESLTTECRVYLRTSNGVTDDGGLRNVSGDISLRIDSQGDAWTVSKANRRLTINQSIVEKRAAVAYSASMTIDAATGNIFTIVDTNGVAFTINAPTNPADGQRIIVEISNTSGGALGAATWNAVFKMVAWTNPANGFSRAIEFFYNGANWRQIGTPLDVAN